MYRRYYIRVTRHAQCIDAVEFREICRDAVVFGDVPVAVNYLNTRLLLIQPVKERPSHNPHECGILEALSPFYVCRKLDLPLVVGIVARLTQGYEVVRCVATRFTVFQVVHVKYLILRSPFAALAYMPVAEQDVLLHVPEAQLRILDMHCQRFLGF